MSPGDFEFVARHIVVKHPEYWCEIDEYRRGDDQLLLGHIRFIKVSPSAFKRLLKEWRLLRQCVTAPIFAVCGEGSPEVWERFVAHLGFQPFGMEVECNNGALRQLYISTVKR